ncbi:MAG: hypothetical protein R2787_10420 [Saprospiraceae bacterium]
MTNQRFGGIRFLGILLSLCLISSVVSAQAPAYKVKVATDLMNELKAAKGILPTEKPYFFLQDTLPNPRFRVAMAFPTYGEIYLEESAYDLCVSKFGKDSLRALSVILSHELMHFMNKHGVVNHFAWKFDEKFTQDSTVLEILDETLPDNDVEKSGFITKVESLLKSYQSRKNEAQADLEGGFVSYLAGYPIGDISPRLMDEIYAYYGIDSVLQTYPSLAERRGIAVSTADRLQELEHWFEGANLLVSMGRYELALANYNRLVGEFPGRAIYNNMGLICLLAADTYFQGNERPAFMLPYALDLNSRMARNSRGDEDTAKRKAKRDSLLLLAVDYFTRASAIDGNYPLATLNLGCAELMRSWSWKNDPKQATEYLARAQSLALMTERILTSTGDWDGRTRTARSARILQALALFARGDTLQSRRQLEVLAAEAPDDDRISTNLNLVMDSRAVTMMGASTGTCPKKPVPFSPAYLNDRTMKTVKDYFMKIIPTSVENIVEPGERPRDTQALTFNYKEEPKGVMVYANTWWDMSGKTYQIGIMWGPRGYDELMPCDLEIGDVTTDELDRSYGQPTYITPYANGEIRYYARGNEVITNDAMQQIGMDYYGLIVLVEEGKGPVQWGITLTYEPI